MGAMTGLLLLLWAGVTVGSVLDLQKRVIRGRDCIDGERQYHVKLLSRKGTDTSICGGSLISDQWILTAAHCWKGRGWTMTVYLDRSPVGVEITEHVIYKDGNKNEHDIMLLKLPEGTTIKPVDLPDCKNHLNIGDKVQIAGHGRTALDFSNIKKVKGPQGLPVKLQCGDMNVVDCAPIEACLKKKYSWSSKELWLCYKDKAEIVDAAPGDSGGGVVVKNMIYGVHSGGTDYACVDAAEAMNVCHPKYLKWINKTIKPKKNCPGFPSCFG